MKRERKNLLTVMLLAMAVIQIPLFYYSDNILLLIAYGFIGFTLSIWLLVNIIFYRSTTSILHIIGMIAIIVIIGCMRITRKLMVNIDHNIQKQKRLEVVKQVKSGRLKKGNPLYDNLLINKNDKGIVSMEFIVKYGFLDHYSSFLYTNDPKEMKRLDKFDNSQHISIDKIETNWYWMTN